MHIFQPNYRHQNKYKPSRCEFNLFENFDSFVKYVREESLSRKIVKIGDNTVIFGVEGPIILSNGKFWSVSAEVKNGIWGKHYIIIAPNIETLIKRKQSFLRLDSGCSSGMVFGDITCDCLRQLRSAQNVALQHGGIIIHMPSHDGRGWQDYKMANQRIMDECDVDTITAAVAFYGNRKMIDCRTYEEAVIILKALGFPAGYNFDLGTKNPKKLSALIDAGFTVSSSPLKIRKPSEHISKNLKAKYKYWQSVTQGEEHESSKKR
ncbi:MAG: hypothetical protein ABIJ84_03895 [bacterium]